MKKTAEKISCGPLIKLLFRRNYFLVCSKKIYFNSSSLIFCDVVWCENIYIQYYLNKLKTITIKINYKKQNELFFPTCLL